MPSAARCAHGPKEDNEGFCTFSPLTIASITLMQSLKLHVIQYVERYVAHLK